MYIVIDKDTKEFLNDLGTTRKAKGKVKVESIQKGLDTSKEALIYIDNKSPLVKILHSKPKDKVKILFSGEDVVGLKYM